MARVVIIKRKLHDQVVISRAIQVPGNLTEEEALAFPYQACDLEKKRICALFPEFSTAEWVSEVMELHTAAPFTPLQLATKFHNAYEELAPSFGYETRQDTRQFDPTTPNGRLMQAVCDRLLIRDLFPNV